MNARAGLGILVASFTFALTGGALGFGFGYLLPLSYDDFIAGDATWRAAGKTSDVLAVLGFVIGFAASLMLLTYWKSCLTRQGEAFASSFERILTTALIPLGFWMGSQFLSAASPSFAVIALTAIGLGASIGVFALSRNAGPDQAGYFALRAFWIAILLPPAFLVFCFARSRFGLPMPATLIGTGMLTLAAFAVLFILSYRCDMLRLLATSVIGAQALLAFYYIALLPSPLTMAGEPFAYPMTPLLGAAVILLVAGGLLDLIRRTRRYRTERNLDLLFSPLCLAGLLVALIIPVSPAPMIFADDYHHGEHLVPFWMWLQGAVPYADIALAHGFADDFLSGASAKFFLSDQATNYYAAGQIGRGFLRIALFLSAVPVLGLPFAFLTGLLSAGLQPWYMLALTYLFLLYRLRRQIALVPVALLGGYALFLGWPGLGAAMLLALAIPLAIWCLGAHPLRRLLCWKLASLAVILAALFYVPSLFHLTFAALRYVLENGAVNFEAYGIPWSASWNGDLQKMSGALFEAVRFSWLLLPLLAVWLWNARQLDWRTRRDEIILLGFGLLFLLLIASYSLGRIDPGYMFRAGQASMVALILCGWVMLSIGAPEKRGPLFACLALWAGLFTVIPQDPFAQLWKGFREQREGAPLTDFSTHDMPWIGRGVAGAEHLARIEAVKRIVDKVADENETFLDLTNRTALYYYLHRPMPIEAAPYNQPHRAMQARSVAQLEANPPPLVLLSAQGFQHDGRSVAIRAPQIYRWVIARYIPLRIGELIVGVRPDRVARLGITTPQDPLPLWDEAFRISQLDRLPVAWGRAGNLEDRMAKIADLPAPTVSGLTPGKDGFHASGDAPAFRFTLPAAIRHGKDAGLLRFHLACASSRAKPIFDLRWREAGKPEAAENSVRFQASPGKLILPLDAMPRWLLAEKLESLTLAIVEGGGCESFRLKDAGLYQRR